MSRENSSYSKDNLVFSQQIQTFKINPKQVNSQIHDIQINTKNNYNSISQLQIKRKSHEITSLKGKPLKLINPRSSKFRTVRSYDKSQEEILEDDESVSSQPKCFHLPKNKFNLTNNDFKSKFETNNEKFYNEESENIFYKNQDDYCSDCQIQLKEIRRRCNYCFENLIDNTVGKENNFQSENSESKQKTLISSDICLECWNNLNQTTVLCDLCKDIGDLRSRDNILVSKRIIMKKDSSKIGKTIRELDYLSDTKNVDCGFTIQHFQEDNNFMELAEENKVSYNANWDQIHLETKQDLSLKIFSMLVPESKEKLDKTEFNDGDDNYQENTQTNKYTLTFIFKHIFVTIICFFLDNIRC